MRYRIKAVFQTKAGKEFVRYWRNSNGVTGWMFPEVKDLADTFTAKDAVRFVADRPNAVGRLSYEPVR